MRKLLIPLLAALALHTAVNAGSVWLVLQMAVTVAALEKIEMKSMEQCEEQGKIYKTNGGYNYYTCLIGK